MANPTAILGEQFRLDEKVAVVTGASKGIGAAIARGLAEFGAKVVVSSRKQEAVDQVAEDLTGLGYEAVGIACHMGETAQIQTLVEKTVHRYGQLDIVVNNAAVNPMYGPLSGMTEAVFDKIMAVNLKGPFTLCQQAYPHMKAQGGGAVINISSISGLKPDPGLGLYGTSKAGLILMTQALAKEWGPDGIRANVICPGLVKTKLSAAIWQNDHLLKHFTQGLPAGRMATPEEMAGLAVFLASPAAAYCTGGVYLADGGNMLG